MQKTFLLLIAILCNTHLLANMEFTAPTMQNAKGINPVHNAISDNILDRVEKLISHHELEWADSLLRLEQIDTSYSGESYRRHYITGLLYYNMENYEDAISSMNKALVLMDSLQIWDCDNYLKSAYYLADSYMHLNMLNECEAVINYSLVKCISSYSTCIYGKNIFQLMLSLYEERGFSSAIIEQVHNEIQKIAVNIYCNNNLHEDGEEIKKGFMLFYDYILASHYLSPNDSLLMNQGKANYLYMIGEFEEAIRLYEKVKMKLPKYDEQMKVINESLLVMYSSMAQTEKIDKLLPEMYDYSLQKKLDYDFYSLNVWVGHNLYQNGHFREAQYYYQLCDSFLYTNNTIPNWIEKKKNVLSRMVFNCRSLSDFEKIISYCRDYSELAESKDFDNFFFIHYNLGYALLALEKIKDAADELAALKKYIQLEKMNNHQSYVMTNCILSICYVKSQQNDKSIECASTAIDLYKSLGMNDNSILASLYNTLGKAYLQKGAYDKALSFLTHSAEIQIEQTGMVSKNTQSNIDECKRQLQ